MRQAVEQERQQRREALQQVGRGSATGFAGGARYHDSNFALVANMRLIFLFYFPQNPQPKPEPQPGKDAWRREFNHTTAFFDKYGF